MHVDVVQYPSVYRVPCNVCFVQHVPPLGAKHRGCAAFASQSDGKQVPSTHSIPGCGQTTAVQAAPDGAAQVQLSSSHVPFSWAPQNAVQSASVVQSCAP